jgi:hypothetical protein
MLDATSTGSLVIDAGLDQHTPLGRRWGIVAQIAQVLWLLVLITTFSTAAHAQFLDDFDDNWTNPAVWTASIQATGPSIVETNQGVSIFFPPGSSTPPGTFLQGIYTTNCSLHGDFDARVDFSLPVWPVSNGARVGLCAKYGCVDRTSLSSNPFEFACAPTRENYAADFGYTESQICSTFNSTTDLTGTLRLERVGSTMTGYYLSGQSWITVTSATVPTDDVSVTIKSWDLSQDFHNELINPVFDNLVVIKGGRCSDGLAQPDNETLKWLDCPLYQGVFDVVAGDLHQLRQASGDFSQAGIRCLADQSTVSSVTDSSIPPLGDAWFYIVRTAQPCGTGSYDDDSPSQVGSRDAGIAAAPGACL